MKMIKTNQMIKKLLLTLSLILFPMASFAQTALTLDATPTVSYDVRFADDNTPEVHLTWKVNNDACYGFVIRKVVDGQKQNIAVYNPPTDGNYIGNSGFYIDLDVVQNQTYTYFVSAFNTLGQESDETSVTVNVVPPTDQGIVQSGSSENSVRIIVSRPSEQNTEEGNKLLVVGGAKVTLIRVGANTYFDNLDSSIDGYIAAKVVDGMIERTYFGAYDSTQFLHQTVDATIPDNGRNSSLDIIGLQAGNYLMTINKRGFNQAKLIFKLSDGQVATLDPRATIIQPNSSAEPPGSSSEVTFSVDGAYRTVLNGVNLIYQAANAVRGWFVAN